MNNRLLLPPKRKVVRGPERAAVEVPKQGFPDSLSRQGDRLGPPRLHACHEIPCSEETFRTTQLARLGGRSTHQVGDADAAFRGQEVGFGRAVGPRDDARPKEQGPKEIRRVGKVRAGTGGQDARVQTYHEQSQVRAHRVRDRLWQVSVEGRVGVWTGNFFPLALVDPF